MLHVKGLLLEQLHHEIVNRVRIGGHDVPIDAQKNVYHCEGHAFVSIDEWMILDQAFEKGRRFVHNRVVVPGLWPMQRRLQRSNISNAGGTAVALDKLLMKKEGISRRTVLSHLARDRYSSSRSL